MIQDAARRPRRGVRPRRPRLGRRGHDLPGRPPVITDASLGTLVLGFGAAGPIEQTPAILLHGNNDTP